jgi:cytochrome c oxidase cbb3-type subunit III
MSGLGSTRRTSLVRPSAAWRFAVAATLPLAAMLGGCEAERRGTQDRPLARPGAPTMVITSDLIAGEVMLRPRIRNPYEGNAHAVMEGRRFYMWFNCHGCHGMAGGGGIAPPFADSDWIYGSDPENVYQSIVQGRPNGMPAFNRLSDDVVWKLVSYVRTLDDELGAMPVGADALGVPRMTPEDRVPENE